MSQNITPKTKALMVDWTASDEIKQGCAKAVKELFSTNMKPKNPAAVSLGKLARGVPKSFTQAELDRRRKRLADARGKRWPKKFTGQQDIAD